MGMAQVILDLALDCFKGMFLQYQLFILFQQELSPGRWSGSPESALSHPLLFHISRTAIMAEL